MKASEHPTTLFEHLGLIENQCVAKPLHEEDLITVVLDAAPQKYGKTLMMEQRRLSAALTMENLESAMLRQYRQIAKKNDEGQ